MDGASLSRLLDTGADATDDGCMDRLTREDIDAKLETVEVRLDSRVAAIEKSAEDIVAAISNLKATMFLTAATTAATIVLGVAAFNATVLTNMVASYESGRNSTAAQAEVKRQTEETARLLRELESRMSRDAIAPTRPAPET